MAGEQEPVAPVILSLEDVAKSFGGLRALDGCTLAVRTGSITGVIGPNGAGKSTTIEVISGFLAPDSGRITFGGRPIQGLKPHVISRIGLVRTFQIPREWPRLTLLENLLVAAPQWRSETIWRGLLRRGWGYQVDRADLDRATEILAMWGMSRLGNEYAGNLSGGQKRLLEFGRILMAKPRLALLDEPLAGVNPVLTDRIAEAIHDLNSEGITILIVEHNLKMVESLCTEVVAMALGKVLATGTMKTLRADEQVVAAYLGEGAADD
jgi:branched-chain amino acid transport system ATP-binding protein